MGEGQGGQRTLLVATANPGKLREMRAILASLPLRVVSPEDIGLSLSVVEDCATFRGNALIKARAYAAASGLPALADDSGLEVDALEGRPGVHSARYGGKGASDAGRRRLLLRELKGVPVELRQARFRCVVVLEWDGYMHMTEGEVEGRITTEERGSGGFGYDPIFLLPELGRTMAELAPEEKNALSHRGRAVRAMAAVIERLLRDGPASANRS